MKSWIRSLTTIQRKNFLYSSGLNFEGLAGLSSLLSFPRKRESLQSHLQISNRIAIKPSVLFLILILIFSVSVEAKIRNMSIERELFLTLRDFREPRPGDDSKFILDTETNEIDISDFVRIIRRAKKSKYNNFPIIDSQIKKQIIDDYFVPWCEKRATNISDCKDKAINKLKRAITDLGQELSQDIRYPYDYYLMDTPEGVDALSEVRELLASKCPDCNKVHLDHGSKSKFDSLFPLIEKQKPSCLKKIVTNMARRLKHYRIPESCEKNKNHPICKNMIENYKLFRGRLLRLTELVYGQLARSQTEMRLCVDCVRYSDKEKTEALDPKSFEDVWQQSRNCEELQSNRQKRVSSGTALNKEYTIRREEDDSYSAVLNLQFVAAEDYEGEVPKDQVSSHYRNQVQQCLKKANEKMLGPKGEKFQIVLAEKPSEQSSCPEPVETIEIGRPGVFSFSHKYASDVDCPVITHEILHQMGLCDDYLIQTRGYIVDSQTGKPIGDEVENIYKVGKLPPGQSVVLKYNCRVTRTNSVMAHHYARWADVFSRRTEKSLLTPQQFSAILYGDCKSRNQQFNECSQLAYTNSFEDKTCLEKRKKCEEQKALGTP